MELYCEVEVVEKYFLGEGCFKIILSWDKEVVDCFCKNINVYIIFFGINIFKDYKKVKELGVNGVMVDFLS